jgi:hypothetical protein
MHMLTEDQTATYVEAMRHHRLHGRPELAQRIQMYYDEGEEVPAELEYLLTVGDGPPTPLPEIEAPPRTGQGATKKAWRKFMVEASTVDPDVIERTTMRDLIKMAEANGLIPKD